MTVDPIGWILATSVLAITIVLLVWAGLNALVMTLDAGHSCEYCDPEAWRVVREQRMGEYEEGQR